MHSGRFRRRVTGLAVAMAAVMTVAASAAVVAPAGPAAADVLPPDYPPRCPPTVTPRDVVILGTVDYCLLTGTHVSVTVTPTVVPPGGLVTVTSTITSSLPVCSPLEKGPISGWWDQSGKPTWSVGAGCVQPPSAVGGPDAVNFIGGGFPTLTPVAPAACVQAGIAGSAQSCTYRVDYDPKLVHSGYWSMHAVVIVKSESPNPPGVVGSSGGYEPAPPSPQCPVGCERIYNSWVDYDQQAFKTTDGTTPPPPVASFTSSQLDPTKPIFSFDASASTGTAPLSYDWDYGDGNTALNAGGTPSHTYAGPGKYTVKLTVHDGIGQTATVSHDVIIPGFVVNSTGDAGDATPADGVCDTGALVAGGKPECTLRAAIQEADASSTAALQPITFNIPGTGVPTIEPQAALPAVTKAVSIDGTSQPGGQVELSGNGTPSGTDGLVLNSKGNTVKGMVINGWGGATAVHITGAGGNEITGNLIGPAPDGSASTGDNLANLVGVLIDNSPGNTIGGSGTDTNVITNNVGSNDTSAAVFVKGTGASDNTIDGNTLGKATTKDVIGNTTGVHISGAPDTKVGDTVGNVIVGNDADLWLDGRDAAVAGTTVKNNRIGIDKSDHVPGNAASQNGIVTTGAVTNSTISNNTVSGHVFDIAILGATATSNTIDNNRVGTTSSGGDLVVSGASEGVSVLGAPGTHITNNLIAGHPDLDVVVIGVTQGEVVVGPHGSDFDPSFVLTGTPTATGTEISGNTIGVLTGNALPTKRAAKGIYLGNTASTSVETGNLISGHTGVEVEVAGGHDNTIAGNVIGPTRGGTGIIGSNVGVRVRGAAATTVGLVGSPNLISGLSGNGVVVLGGLKGTDTSPAASQTTIAANLIGTTANGLAALRDSTGIVVGDGATNTTVGQPGAGNVIAANTVAGIGVVSTASAAAAGITSPAIATTAAPPSGVTIAANSIGVTSGGSALPNAVGIALSAGSGITVGGLGTGAGNTIAFNTNGGIVRLPHGPAGVTILSNSIHDNGSDGISLDVDATNPKPPLLQTAALDGNGHTVVTGTLPSAPPSSVYRLQLFTNTACDSSGRGQGQVVLDGNEAVIANGSPFMITTPAVPVGTPVTATVTDATLGTSEFSNCQATKPPAIVNTSTGVTASPTPFGQPVVVSATVSPASGSTAPTGAVQFAIGPTNVGGPVSLTGGQASITLPSLVPGQTVTASYGGAPGFVKSSGSVTPVITFSHPTVSGSVPSGTTFSSGTWLLSGATVGGGVSIGPNASVLIMNSTVSGNITASGGGAFGLCGTTTYGSVTVANASGFVVVGDPLDDGCAANTLNSGLTLSSNHGGVEVSHNARIGGTVTLQANSGPGANPDDVHPEIEANTIYGGLICSGDSPNAVDDAQRNTVSGARAGECGAPGF